MKFCGVKMLFNDDVLDIVPAKLPATEAVLEDGGDGRRPLNVLSNVDCGDVTFVFIGSSGVD